MITGGSTSTATTLYNPSADIWTVGSKMIVPRGYHSMATMADGSVFTIGGSWHGSVGGKGGEIWHPSTNKWRLLSNVTVTPILTQDLAGEYRSDNHAWLFTAPNGMIFHAGPSRQMNWIDVRNQGAVRPAGTRESSDRMNGNALVINNGVIFVVGGAPNYDTGLGTKNAYIININNPSRVRVRKVGELNYARTLSSSCVLPSGEVVVTGGQSQTVLFSDDFAVLHTEIYNPKTRKFSLLADMHVARTYHSVSILLKDGRVMVAGGGLCGGCSASHKDYEILTPPYLLDATGALAIRPHIRSAPKVAMAGNLITIRMDTNQTHTFALVRTSSATHSVNNDQRRIPLFVVSKAGTMFRARIPRNVNVALTGVYYLFAMNTNGVPSKAVDLRIIAAPHMAPTPAPTLPPVPVVPFSDNGSWIALDNNAPITARHENCFAMVENSVVGRKAYLAGGRGPKSLDIFDPVTRTWTAGAAPPTEFHHTQVRCFVMDSEKNSCNIDVLTVCCGSGQTLGRGCMGWELSYGIKCCINSCIRSCSK
jgi:galactose oxidase